MGADAVTPSSLSGLSQSSTPAQSTSGEHRQVTVLVADMVGYTAFVEQAGGEAAYALMGRIARLMTSALRQHRGTVMNYTGDGIIALFGAPIGLEDGPLRACRAALEILQFLAEKGAEFFAEIGLRPQLRISIATGPVVLGAVDSGESTSVTAYGDVINLAARLQTAAAPDTVIISEATLRQVEGVVETAFAGVFHFKGKTEPQPGYRLMSVRDHATRFDAAVARGLTSFIGRSHELKVLEEEFRHLGSVRIVDIVGDPGIGKSRLLYEFTRRHDAEHTCVLRGNCSADGQGTPFLPFIEAIRAFFSIVPGEDEAAIRSKLSMGLQRLGCASQLNLGLLLNLLGLNAPDGALAGLDGILVGARTRDLLLRLLEAQCLHAPTILVLEDLHWVDSASEELLLRIVDHGKAVPLMVLHTRRPDYDPPWAGSAGVVRMQLAPLSLSEAMRIAKIRWGVKEVPQPLAQLVTDKAEGNPLFVEEITSFLVERGTVRRTSEGLAYDTNTAVATLPATVELLLRARVDRLTPGDRALLQIAAVIGRRFDPKLLSEAAELFGRVEQRLSAIEAPDLLQRHEASGDYVFKHVLIRDALYDSLVSSRRAELHLKVAKAIELRSAHRLGEVAETLAFHFSAAARHDKAFHYLSLAGQKCLDIYSLEEAERYYREALRVHEVTPRCADDQSLAAVVANLMQVLYLRGDLRHLEVIAKTYIQRVQAFGDAQHLVFALYFHSMLLDHHCDFRGAEASAKSALEIATRLGNVRAQAYAQSALFFCSTILARYSLEIAEVEGARMLDTCARSGDNYILNWAYWSIAWDYVCRGLTQKARAWTRKLIEAGQQRQDNRALGMAYWTIAWIDMQDGNYREAVTNAQKCLKTAATPFDHTAGTHATATGLLLEGRVREALTQLLTLKEWALANGWLYAASGIDYAAGPALAMTGRISEGIRLLKSGITACDAAGSRAIASFNRLALAELYLNMLLTRERPPFGLIIANLGAVLRVLIFGPRLVQRLLCEAGRNEQFHESGCTRCRIEINFAKFFLQQKRPDLSRAHLLKARAAAISQHSTPLLDQINTLERAVTYVEGEAASSSVSAGT